jgi:hypothetical protein
MNDIQPAPYPTGSGRISQTLRSLRDEVRRVRIVRSKGLRFRTGSRGTTLIIPPETEAAGGEAVWL